MARFRVDLAKRYEPVLSRIAACVRRAERFLGPDDDWVEDARRRLYTAAHGVLDQRTIKAKSARDYVTTVEASPDTVEEALHPQYERNLVSTRKYRTVKEDERQWACGSWVHDPPDTETQHHVFLFEAPDGRTDLYAHYETSVRDPDGHFRGDTFVPGDPNGRARGLLSVAGMAFHRRDIGT